MKRIFNANIFFKKAFFALVFVVPNSFCAQNYIFFLHNKFLEEYSLEDAHPEYGKCEYTQILNDFKKEGLQVISELRKKNTNVSISATKVVKQIDSLLALGVKPGQITVVGTSKGGYIAQAVSILLKNDKVNYIFIGCCNRSDLPESSGTFYGNILSIYEKSDSLGQSCIEIKNRSVKSVKHFKEIQLATGLKHGFLYKALPQWIEPSVKWAKQTYD